MTPLETWLARIEQMHPASIAMGLERVHEVAARMQLRPPRVVTVAGTNGKGSTCAMLESILRHAGYRVGLMTSPHLLAFNERAVVDGLPASDDDLILSFERVELQRQGVPLTYFEFTTLAILDLFSRAALDVWVLEVGMGGRLDAVNVIDADCAVITSIDLDHQAYLGPDRETIGREKAGVFRAGRPAVYADPVPVASVIERAEQLGVDLWLFGRDFNYAGDRQQWSFAGRQARRSSLAYPALRGANQLLNASAALAALEAMSAGDNPLMIPAQAVRTGLLLVQWPGRFQVLPGQPVIVLDVAHNPHAAGHLRANLDQMGFFPRTLAVFGMLADKDAEAVVHALQGKIDHWFCVDTEGARGRPADVLRQQVQALVNDERDALGQPRQVDAHVSVAAALQAAQSVAESGDRIVVFGSFVVVAAALACLQRTASVGSQSA